MAEPSVLQTAVAAAQAVGDGRHARGRHHPGARHDPRGPGAEVERGRRRPGRGHGRRAGRRDRPGAAAPARRALPGCSALGHGRGYVYPHDVTGGVAEQQYLPDELVDRGLLPPDRARCRGRVGRHRPPPARAARTAEPTSPVRVGPHAQDRVGRHRSGRGHRRLSTRPAGDGRRQGARRRAERPAGRRLRGHARLAQRARAPGRVGRPAAPADPVPTPGTAAARVLSRSRTTQRPRARRVVVDSAEIRSRFLRYFADRGHQVVPSASLLLDDPTLLFVNAGMVPFKPYFLGEAPPPYPRATSVQKVVRTLDIEEVGKTARHASFFQMAGNFSFGDYFKEGAIPLAWELLTKPVADGGYGFPEAKLWATVYEDDDEALDIWHRTVGRAARPHPAPQCEGQLLVDGRARTRWPVLGDLLRPRARVRARGRPRGRRGSLPRGLEPRLHAGRALRRCGPRPTSTSASRCRRRTSTPAWASSGWRRSSRASTTCTRSTPRAASSTAPASSAVRVRRQRARRRRPSRRRRPRPHVRVPHRRRRHPRQRGSRLRPAAHHAPHDPHDAAARRARADDERARRRRRC